MSYEHDDFWIWDDYMDKISDIKFNQLFSSLLERFNLFLYSPKSSINLGNPMEKYNFTTSP